MKYKTYVVYGKIPFAYSIKAKDKEHAAELVNDLPLAEIVESGVCNDNPNLDIDPDDAVQTK